MRVIFLPLVAIASMLSADAATFVVSTVNDRGPGSLHQAITDANAARGHDEILFNIAGAGVHKIDIQRLGLPEITDPVTIDGYTQPGARPNTRSVGNDAVILIQIDGADNYRTGPVNGLVISGGDSVIRGLSITGIPARIYYGIPEDPPPPPPEGNAILLKGNGGNVIEGNFIGFAPNGQAVDYGAYIGVEVLSNGNRIGGTSPASRNVIARHETNMVVRGADTVIQGNYIGTDISGSARARSGVTSGFGIVIGGSDFLIGGTLPGAGNVISGNLRGGIIIQAPASGGTIHGNLIGRAADGLTIVANDSSYDIESSGADMRIGGLEPGAANTMTNSVVLRASRTGSWPRRNSILSNRYRHENPIHLGYQRLPRLDLGDTDTGPNDLQNFPVITSITSDGQGQVRLQGGLNSTPSSNFILQFYRMRTTSTDTELLGTIEVTTDTAGIASFDVSVPFPGDLRQYDFISGTATSQDGNTSEFAPSNPRVHLANLSTRGRVGVDERILIGGLITRNSFGSSRPLQKKVLIRAIGPSLSAGGVPLPDRLEDPVLQLLDGEGKLLAENDNWRDSQANEILATNAAPAHQAEAAIIVTLSEGAFTAQVRGANGGVGLGMVEIFDLDPLDSLSGVGSGRLINISTRGYVGTGDDVLIGGAIVNGDGAHTLMVRALGLDLAAVGLDGALDDPVLELRDASGNLVAMNDNWQDTQKAEIESAGLIPTNQWNSALITKVMPGLYTAIVTGKDGRTGLAVVEFYDLLRQ